MTRFTLSSLTLADPPGRARLHSRFFGLYSRLFSVLLFVGACQLAWAVTAPGVHHDTWPELAKYLVMFLAILAVSRYLWLRPKAVVATRDGLEVSTRRKTRLIPWSRVLDVREMPSVRMHPFTHPRMWQVDLDRGECFEFCGTFRARAIVKEYIEKAEARHPESKPPLG